MSMYVLACNGCIEIDVSFEFVLKYTIFVYLFLVIFSTFPSFLLSAVDELALRYA